MKKILALALAGLPLVASAESVIYGKLKMGLENDRISGLYDGSKRFGTKSNTRLQDYGTRIGFAGGENIGAGLRAIWQIELGLGPDSAAIDGVGHDLAYASGAPRVALRDSYVGLEGNFGKVRAGRLSNVFMDNASASGKFGILDNWESENGVNSLQTYSRFDKRINNSVRYDSPNWAGFSFAAQYGLDERTIGRTESINGVSANIDDDIKNKRQHVMGLGLAYTHGSGFFAGLGHERSRAYSEAYRSVHPNTVGDHYPTAQRTRIEAGYDANNLLVALGYQMAKDNVPYISDMIDFADGLNNVGLYKAREAGTTVGYRFGRFMPKVSFVKGWNAKFADYNTDVFNAQVQNVVLGTAYNHIILGADYDVTKRTRVGFAYGQQKFKSMPRTADGSYFGTERPVATNRFAAGAKQRTFGVNLVHAF